MGEHDNRYTLITGATGFIGSHVAEKLLRDGSWPVVGIVRRLGGYKNTQKLQKRGAILVEGNFYDPDLLNHVFKEFPIQNVVHLAALVGEGKGGWRKYYHVNVQGTESLLTISQRKGVEKFIYCSSVGVFGIIPAELPANLNTPLNADSLYHRSKLAAEKRVWEFIQKGLNAFIIRPTIAYGQGDTGFPYKLVKMVRRRVLLLPFRDNRIHLVSVSSLAEMFLRLLKTDIIHNRVFIVADEGPVVLRELVNTIHGFYFGTEYPSFLKVPNGVLEALQHFFGHTHCTNWCGKLQRISTDCFYDVSSAESLFREEIANTIKEFCRYLQLFK